MTTRLAAFVLFSVPTLVLAQAPSLNGVFSVVNNGPGHQTDPHVDCDLAPYTNDDNEGTLQIRYYDFVTGADQAVPGNGADSLSDVSGSRIAFTEGTAFGSQVIIFDTATQSRTIIPGFQTRKPALGGNQLAFEDRSYSANANQSEIVLFDLGSQARTRVTSDTLLDKNPALSPDGSALVWEKCQSAGTRAGLDCDIYSAVRTGPSTISTQLLTGPGEDRGPDTNGSLVVYVSDRSGENDIYYQPVSGGAETRLSIPGDQRDVSISGSLIAFESNGGGPQYDIHVFDVANNILYQVTNTPVNETLNDVSVCGGAGRVVYAAPAADFDVLAYTFTPPPPPPPPPGGDCGSPEASCEDPGDRPLLAELSVTRGTGAPDTASTVFGSADQNGLVCITNDRATSGALSLNGLRAVGPDPFKHQVDLIAVYVDGLGASNALEASIAGQPGTSFQVKVYGADRSCELNGGDRGQGRERLTSGEVTVVAGEHVTSAVSGGRVTRMHYDLDEPLEAGAAMGCSATGSSGLALSALAVMALWLVTRRRPALARRRS